MTAVADAPTGELSLGDSRPVPVWKHARRNIVKVTYIAEGSKGPRSFTGRIVSTTNETLTMLQIQSGEPKTINLSRIRGLVVMSEGDVGGRNRMVAVRTLVNAARALASSRHVGGSIERAADLIAFVMEMFPELKNGDPQKIWDEMQISGINIE